MRMPIERRSVDLPPPIAWAGIVLLSFTNSARISSPSWFGEDALADQRIDQSAAVLREDGQRGRNNGRKEKAGLE
jgi:hypothetical protein